MLTVRQLAAKVVDWLADGKAKDVVSVRVIKRDENGGLVYARVVDITFAYSTRQMIAIDEDELDQAAKTLD